MRTSLFAAIAAAAFIGWLVQNGKIDPRLIPEAAGLAIFGIVLAASTWRRP